MAFSNDELSQLKELYGDLLSHLKEARETRHSELDVTREINDAIREQLSLVKNNLDFKTSTRRALDQINKLAEANVDFTKEERDILLSQDSLLKRQNNLLKTQASLDRERLAAKRRLKTLENELSNAKDKQKEDPSDENEKTIKDLEEQIEAFTSLNVSISDALINSEVFAKNLTQALNSSKELDKLSTPKMFEGLSDITNSIPGLRKLSGPFQEAAKEAKETAAAQVAANLATKQKIAHYKNLRKEGVGIKAALDEAGVSAKEVSRGFTFRPASIGLNSLKAGFKALGPVIKKAIGPVGIILAIVEAVKFAVDAMFEASDATAKFSNNLLISREASRDLWKSTYDTVGLYNELAIKEGRFTIQRKEYIKAMFDVNEQLGLQLNLNQNFGEQTSQNIALVATMNEKWGLSAKASTQLLMDSERMGISLEDYSNQLMGQIHLQSQSSGLMVDFRKTIEEAVNISGELRANFKGSTLEISKAVYQSKLLGLTLDQGLSISNHLLDFQSSIESEMQAELLTGRQLNLERAREAALRGDTLSVIKEITSQGITQQDYLKMNVIQQRAFAAAVGMSNGELADAYQKQVDLAAFEQKSLKLRNQLKKKGLEIDNEAIKGREEELFELADKLKKAGHTQTEINEAVGKQAISFVEQKSASEDFSRALDQLKEKLVSLVDGEVLDNLIAGITGLTESWLFKGFIEDGKARKNAEIIREEAKKPNSNISDGDKMDAYIASQSKSWMKGSYTLGKEILTPSNYMLGEKGELSRKRALHNISLTHPLIIQEARDRTEEKIKTFSPQDAEDVEDFIIRPGQRPLKFRKDDIIIGGTKLLDTPQSQGMSSTQLDQINNKLERLIQVIQQGGNVYMDSIKVGETISKTLTQIS